MSKYPISAVDAMPADLAWMVGNWSGLHGTDPIDEYWSVLGAGTLMGMFRWVHEGRVRFYEFMTLEREGEELILRIKHFNPGLVGWEEKDESKEFVLVRLEKQEAVFLQRHTAKTPWMIYRLENAQTLVAYFEVEDESVTDEDKFVYTRLAIGGRQ